MREEIFLELEEAGVWMEKMILGNFLPSKMAVGTRII
jgi:hypothetical protein